MKRKLIFTIFFLATSFLVPIINIQHIEAQEPPATEWTKTYGGSYDEWANSVVQTNDGGFVFVGHKESSGEASSRDVWAVKIDSQGIVEWNQTYGGNESDFAQSVLAVDDGLIMTGVTSSFGLDSPNCFVVKTSHDGNIQWNKTFGGMGRYWSESIIKTNDNGYAIVGHCEKQQREPWLIKIDVNGNAEWNRTYGMLGSTSCLAQTSDGGYILAGWSSVGSDDGNNDALLIKVDIDGNLEWKKNFGGTNDDWVYCIVPTSDGGYALAGGKGIGPLGGDPIGDAWLVKVDSLGDLEWEKTYGGHKEDCAMFLVQIPDEGYALVGYYWKTYDSAYGAWGDWDGWIVRTDSNGEQVWTKTFGGKSFDSLSCILRTNDGGFILAGQMDVNEGLGTSNNDAWLIKLASEQRLDETSWLIQNLHWVIIVFLILAFLGGSLCWRMKGAKNENPARTLVQSGSYEKPN